MSAFSRSTGSIPAHAGEPARPVAVRYVGAVYPRPRGGTHAGVVAFDSDKGLSPPTRGNRRMLALIALVDGSIPAHAGEP